MTFQALRSAQDTLRLVPGARELGHLVWWQLNSTTRIDHDDLAAAAKRHGLNPNILPTELKPVQAFRRAWRHATARLTEGLMLRLIAENVDEIVVGLVRERPNEERRDLDYDVVARIAFDKASTRISADAEHAVVAQIRELYQHHLANSRAFSFGMSVSSTSVPASRSTSNVMLQCAPSRACSRSFGSWTTAFGSTRSLSSSWCSFALPHFWQLVKRPLLDAPHEVQLQVFSTVQVRRVRVIDRRPPS